VAELGRAETPDETADRKAAASAERRRNQTAINLVAATLASLGIVALILLVVVRPVSVEREGVDYAAVAADLEDQTGHPLAVPELPAGWSANRAELVEGADGIPTWSVGLLTPSEQYIGLTQGIGASQRWAAAQLESETATGVVRAGGVAWQAYDRRDERDTGNLAYALSASLGDSVVVLGGTASDTEFATLAAAVAASLGGAS
jgi:hypothetical protein